MKISQCGGVYAIRNLKSGDTYIGGTTNFSQRWAIHRHGLRRNAHHAFALQNAWNEHGEEAFDFQVIEVISGDSALLQSREQFWIDRIIPKYNTSLFANGNRSGLTSRDEHRRRISIALNSPESQAKLSARWKGKKQSADHIAARAESMRGNVNGVGHIVTPENRVKMNEGLAKARAEGRVKKAEWTPEQRAKAAEHARRGHAARKAKKEGLT